MATPRRKQKILKFGLERSGKPYESLYLVKDGDRVALIEKEEIATFIMNSCNSQEELLEASKNVLKELDCYCGKFKPEICRKHDLIKEISKKDKT